jgi:predicted acylesterase/phospholipase RssA
MAIKSIFFMCKKINPFARYIVGGAALVFVMSCSQVETRRSTEVAKVPVIAGAPTTLPTNDTFGAEPAEPKLPQKEAQATPHVAVILGPGGYRAFAHATILKEFVKARIPIEKIVGIEWGALAGAFFALDGKAHEAEWKLYKLDRKELAAQGFFARKDEPQSMKALQKYLNENFASRDLSALKVKFACPSLSLQNGTVSFFEKGSAAAAMEMCLSYPPHWLPSRGSVAAALSINEAVDRLRREGYNVIILVNVLGSGPLPLGSDDFGAQVLWNEVRRSVWAAKSRVTDVVEVDMKGLGLYDLDARKGFSQAAEKAAQGAVRTLADKYGF